MMLQINKAKRNLWLKRCGAILMTVMFIALVVSDLSLAENVNQLCFKCHPDKRGPYVYEHPPVAENCATCHTPHGSRHAKLLTEKVPNLCQDCHDWSRHPGTPYDAKTGFTGTSPSNRFFSRSCLNCHGAIHGSTSFENHALTR